MCAMAAVQPTLEKSEKRSFVRGMWDVATTERPKVQHIIRLQQPEFAGGKKRPFVLKLNCKRIFYYLLFSAVLPVGHDQLSWE